MQGRKKIIISSKGGKEPVKVISPLPEAASNIVKWPFLSGGLLVCMMLFFWAGWHLRGERLKNRNLTEAVVADSLTPVPSSDVKRGVVRKSTTPADLFASLGVEERIIRSLLRGKELAELDSMYAGHKFSLIYNDASRKLLRTFEYYPDESRVYRVTFRPIPMVEKVRVPSELRQKVYSGIIAENIWLEILESPALHHDLIPKLEAAVKWTVDIFHLEPGDRFKLIYTERVVGGKVVGVEKLEAVSIRTMGNDSRTYELFLWEQEGKEVYLDNRGESVQSRYLKAPVKFAIISSPYSNVRLHPVTGELKAHYGTDYAAPEGAPIYALADGVVEKAEFEKYNGKNVRLIHDARHKTQYLHMSEFAPAISRGVQVRQGQIIGYVGSTGQSTGPHVCLRFWEDEKQVDFLENQSVAKISLSAQEMEQYQEICKKLEEQFKNVPLSGL